MASSIGSWVGNDGSVLITIETKADGREISTHKTRRITITSIAILICTIRSISIIFISELIRTSYSTSIPILSTHTFIFFYFSPCGSASLSSLLFLYACFILLFLSFLYVFLFSFFCSRVIISRIFFFFFYFFLIYFIIFFILFYFIFFLYFYILFFLLIYFFFFIIFFIFFF